MAKMYWAWTRDCGPGLCSAEVPLVLCQQELQLEAAQPMGCSADLSSGDLTPDGLVLEVRPLEGGGNMAAGFYRLAERRSDAVVQRLLRSF